MPFHRPARLALIVALLVALASTATVRAAPDPTVPPGARHAANELLIQFRAGVSEADKAAVRARLNGAAVVDRIRARGSGDLELSTLSGLSVADAIRTAEASPLVAFAEPNWIYTHDATSNDPYYTNGSLWGMYGDASSPTNRFGSQAAEAWKAGHIGSDGVYVAVIDEGIDRKHRDLSANIWTNPFETLDGADNDGNGYVDDIRGWDFANDDNTIYDPKSSSDTSTDAHGTHVAGTIGASGGNGTGVVGVNWNVTIIPAKFLGSDGGTTWDAIQAIDYVTDLKLRHGLNIVATNNSWGGSGYSQALYDAIEDANDAGILFVAAAGNGGSDGIGDNNDSTPNYPASYASTNIIAVAAINKNGGKPSFSNYGATSVDLGAPGAGIYSTTPRNTYRSYSGTSMATPHVTGAVALYASTHPGASASEIRDAIFSSTVPTTSMSGRTVTGGRLNAGGY